MPSTRRRDEIIARYPVPRSALIMLLHEAQDEVGYVSDDVIMEVGAYLGSRRPTSRAS